MSRELLLEQMAEEMDRLRRALGQHWGPLTRSQYTLMRELLQGPVTVGSLAGRLGISTAGVTRMVDKLEAKGYVRRTRHTDDLRLVSAGLTPSGEEDWRDAHQDYVTRVGTLMSGLSADQLQTLLGLLQSLSGQVSPP